MSDVPGGRAPEDGDPREGSSNVSEHDEAPGGAVPGSEEITDAMAPGAGDQEAEEEPARGPRRVALEERRRIRRRAAGWIVGGAAIAAGAALVTWAWLGARDGPSEPAVAVEGATRLQNDPLTTTLLIGTREGTHGQSSEVVWLALAAHDADRNRGGIVYLPAHTATEVPGRGLQGLGDAFSSGGMPLLLVSAENMLDVGIDSYLELSEQDARVLFDELGPLTVDVPTEVRVPAGPDQARLIFTQGLQELPASFLQRLLYVVGLEGDDAELGSRHLAFWDAVFEAFGDDTDLLYSSFRRAEGALGESDASPASHGRLFRQLGELTEGRRTLGVLPVDQVSAGGEELYQIDDKEASELLRLAVGETAAPDETQRIQVLNGNGVPGVGQEVGQKLVGHGFKVILSGNAAHLDYPKTLIITYEASPEALEVARRARELLGVGEVQISAQPQGIVNLTVVVGKDFSRRD